jgi:hydroxypyruvate isomerase
MARFDPNLAFLYPQLPLAEAMAVVADAGFTGVEFASPYRDDLDVLAKALTRHGLTQVLFNLPMGDAARGDRGFAVDPQRTAEFAAAVEQARRAAVTLGCTRVNCLAGIIPAGVEFSRAHATLLANVASAADRFAAEGVTVLVEHLNALDTPGFFLDTPAKAFAFVEELGHPNVRLQFDFYHAQRSTGNVLATFEALLPAIAHVQISDNPGRTVPGLGELAYDRILGAIDALGYTGWIGLEYVPPSTGDRYGWIERYGFSRSGLPS